MHSYHFQQLALLLFVCLDTVDERVQFQLVVFLEWVEQESLDERVQSPVIVHLLVFMAHHVTHLMGHADTLDAVHLHEPRDLFWLQLVLLFFGLQV